MTKTFTRAAIRSALKMADASTPKTLTAKERAEWAVMHLTDCNLLDAQSAVDMAGFGLGSMRAEELVALAVSRI